VNGGLGSAVTQTVGLKDLTEVLGCTLQEARNCGQLHAEPGFSIHVLWAKNGQVFSGARHVVRDSRGHLDVKEHGAD